MYTSIYKIYEVYGGYVAREGTKWRTGWASVDLGARTSEKGCNTYNSQETGWRNHEGCAPIDYYGSAKLAKSGSLRPGQARTD